VFGPLGRSRSLAVHEFEFARTLSDKPVKIALPGPYLLTRTMWLECISDRAYSHREELATDIVRVLREEIAYLLAAGTSLIQLDEPVLSEVVFSGSVSKRSFMCGALSEKNDVPTELGFARELINAVTAGFPRERIALNSLLAAYCWSCAHLALVRWRYYAPFQTRYVLVLASAIKNTLT
jgi:5-methyltetrahydropteroyltriglutamate--homocysteine methyltransferase